MLERNFAYKTCIPCYVSQEENSKRNGSCGRSVNDILLQVRILDDFRFSGGFVTVGSNSENSSSRQRFPVFLFADISPKSFIVPSRFNFIRGDTFRRFSVKALHFRARDRRKVRSMRQVGREYWELVDLPPWIVDSLPGLLEKLQIFRNRGRRREGVGGERRKDRWRPGSWRVNESSAETSFRITEQKSNCKPPISVRFPLRKPFPRHICLWSVLRLPWQRGMFHFAEFRKLITHSISDFRSEVEP